MSRLVQRAQTARKRARVPPPRRNARTGQDMHNGAIMPSEVAHRADTRDDYPVVRLTGVLDSDGAPALRSALLGVLADQPEALIVDVSDLRLAHSGPDVVLREVAGA